MASIRMSLRGSDLQCSFTAFTLFLGWMVAEALAEMLEEVKKPILQLKGC